MNREEAPGKSPEDMYIQQKVRVLLMLKKMGSNVRRHIDYRKTLPFEVSAHAQLMHTVVIALVGKDTHYNNRKSIP